MNTSLDLLTEIAQKYAVCVCACNQPLENENYVRMRCYIVANAYRDEVSEFIKFYLMKIKTKIYFSRLKN